MPKFGIIPAIILGSIAMDIFPDPYLTCLALFLFCCLFWCLHMMTTAITKKPTLASRISITGAISDQTNDVAGFK